MIANVWSKLLKEIKVFKLIMIKSRETINCREQFLNQQLIKKELNYVLEIIIQQIDSMLPCVCSVIDHRRRLNGLSLRVPPLHCNANEKN